MVMDLYSLENLASCDVVCPDKTGTLTEGSLEVEDVYLYTGERKFGRLIAAYLANTDDNNSTYRALCKRFSRADPYDVVDTTPFSSDRKWSSVTLADGRTLVLGVPERLCRSIPLIPTTVFWWITSVYDRYIIAAMLGDEANGIYLL